MNKLFSIFLFFCVLSIFGFEKPLHAKQVNNYSVITLVNETPFRIFYSYKWGHGEKDYRNSIKPYGTYVHYWKFKRTNQNWAPWFYLHIDGHGPDKWYRLGSFYSPNTKAEKGRTYIFSETGENNVYEIQLYEKLYTE